MGLQPAVWSAPFRGSSSSSSSSAFLRALLRAEVSMESSICSYVGGQCDPKSARIESRDSQKFILEAYPYRWQFGNHTFVASSQVVLRRKA